ncbi:glycosyltransferase [Parvicella tangerina]|uniref:Glycosyltransferase n=1 Tax=Parvicella tangerina TaxID=2829795 RepID=A0A916NI11_9FLAO|nr:glycosyltransferase [Parvicella tangerina]CAG5084152.1 hypothetical protein CRYO30217_02391 [Parvicella tangerina]
MKKKLFVISSRVPYPLDKGDKLRLYHQLKELSKEFEICLCSLDDSGKGHLYLNELKKVVQNTHIIKLTKWRIYLNLLLGAFGRKPYQVHYFYQKAAKKKVDQLIKSFQPDHIYCQLIRAAEYVKGYHEIPKTIDYQDAFSKGIERRIDKAGWLKGLFRSEHKRLLKYENLTFDYFDHHTIISEEDRNFIFHEKRKQIKIIPNGIDTHYFTPKDEERSYELLFVGNMSYAPNIDSAKYIVEEIMPLIWKERPRVKVLIAGSNPTHEVKKLTSDLITISGWVDDIRTAYLDAKIFIAPMRIGSGLQNKLLEAMSMELPCITSSLANKSLNAQHEKEVIVCSSSSSYAKAVLELLDNQMGYERLSKSGRSFVESKFSWKKSVEELAVLLNSSH